MKLPAILPAPFRDEDFQLFQEGISDRADVNVYLNERKDFACLSPQPSVDYQQYSPRVQKLSLQAYKQKQPVWERRYAKVAHLFAAGGKSVLEIGAAEGGFLKLVKEAQPALKLSSVETDEKTRESRRAVVGGNDYASLEEAVKAKQRFDVICFFHVLEHITGPAGFLAAVRQVSHSGTAIIIEVPSLFDPLLSLYQSPAYQRFYFQAQHPFVYSQTSLPRLMEHEGFHTREIIHHQRYGLENHLHWLTAQKPGGNETFRKVLGGAEALYLRDLEKSGKTDTVIWVGTP